MKRFLIMLLGIVFIKSAYAQNALDKTGLTSDRPAATAYALRLLSNAYTGSAIQVRRSSDNTLQNIGFTASGDLDTAALKTFIGANSGFIATWYDQSGYNRNISQATLSRQPSIISSGNIYRRNNRPAIYHDNSDDGLGYSGANYLTTTPLSVNIVAGSNSGSTAYRRAVQGSANWLIGPYSDYHSWYAGGWNHQVNPPWSTTQVESYTVIEPVSTTNTSWRNGVAQSSGNSKGVPNVINTGIIGAYAEPMDGYISEVFCFAAELTSTERQTLEGNQSEYYSMGTITITSHPSIASPTYCVNEAPAALSVTASGTGSLNYQWYSNTTNSNSGGTLLAGATNSTYSPSTTSLGTLYYYVKINYTGGYAIVSNMSGAITVGTSATYYRDADGDGFGNPAISQVSCSVPAGYVLDNTDCNDAIATINPAIFGSNQWNVYGYNGFSYNNYYGYYIDNTLDHNTIIRWSTNGSPSDAIGYQGCGISPDNHSYKAKRKGFPAGCYTISVQSHDDNTTLYINGVQVFQHNGCCDSHANVWAGQLDANTEVEIATQEGGGGSYAYYSFAELGGGTVSANQSVCSGAMPADINITGATGTIQWQSSSDNINFSNISGASTSTLTGSTIGAITTSTYIRAVTTNGSCADTSGVVTLTVKVNPTALISGTTTALDSVSLSASGGVSYTWSGGNSMNSATNTFTASGSYSVTVSSADGCTDSATAVVTINLLGLNKYGAITFDSTVNVNDKGAVATSTKVDKYGRIRNGSRENGSTAATAGSSAYQIKQNFPASADGLYWIKNANINGGTPFQIYADMTTDGGGWTLIMTNSASSGWTYANAISRNTSSPGLSENYSIIGWADYIKRSASGFQYMIDANQRRTFGAIWTANGAYSFVNGNNTQTDITIDTKFGTWSYNDGGIEKIMPWYSNCSGLITTSAICNGSWWGTLISQSGWTPAPWISGGCGVEGCMQNPEVIWYWVR